MGPLSQDLHMSISKPTRYSANQIALKLAQLQASRPYLEISEIPEIGVIVDPRAWNRSEAIFMIKIRYLRIASPLRSFMPFGYRKWRVLRQIPAANFQRGDGKWEWDLFVTETLSLHLI